MSRVVFVCGLPGAGKTTVARELADRLGAVRLCPDEWMAALGIDGYDDAARARIEALQWTIAEEQLRRGSAAVVEWGGWSRRDRDAQLARARAVGPDVAVELRYLDVPFDELWRRVERRNAALPPGTFAIARADLERWHASFEPPDAAELASYDPPAPTA